MRYFAWATLTCGVTAAFGLLGAYNLGNYRPVTNDEVELMAVAYKLATQGVFGSDMYAGFFGADEHVLINPPLQHVLQALTFRLFDAGVVQARAVSLVAGMAVVWLVGLLAFRWYGLLTAVLCELLLVGWPSDLIGAANGLPLFGVARVARYDVLAVASCWLALLLLDALVRRSRVITALGVGMCCGLAALSQFMGTFVLPLVLMNCLLVRMRWPLLGCLLVGAFGVVAPWLAFTALNASDAIGQFSVYAGRGDFLRPDFYLENISLEVTRYAHLAGARSLSNGLLVLGVWPAVAYIAGRSRHSRVLGDRLVWTSLVVLGGLLLLLDHSKSALYAIILAPSICLALSRALGDALGLAWRTKQPFLVRLALSLAAVFVVVSVSRDGLAAYKLTLSQAMNVSAYTAVGEQIERSLTPGGRVLGPERWWWALHEHPYLSLRSLWWQWPANAGAWREAEHVIVNDNVRADLLLFPEAVQQHFWWFLDTCATRIAQLDDATYFGIDIYRVTQPPPRDAACA